MQAVERPNDQKSLSKNFFEVFSVGDYLSYVNYAYKSDRHQFVWMIVTTYNVPSYYIQIIGRLQEEANLNNKKVTLLDKIL